MLDKTQLIRLQQIFRKNYGKEFDLGEIELIAENLLAFDEEIQND